MKRIITNYTFDASAQTVTFDDYASINLEQILLVTNITDGIIIYSFADATKGGTAATNVLTLEYNTTSMADADDLQIFYEVDNLDADDNLKVTLGTTISGEDLVNDILKTEMQFTNTFVSLASGYTTAKASAGLWHNITFGHASTPTLTVYNNASSAGQIIQSFAAGYPQGTYAINAIFNAGLTLQFGPGVIPAVSVRYR